MDRYSGFEVNLLCGAEVVAELRRALAEHCVIFLRDQVLTPEQQKAFARHFGPL